MGAIVLDASKINSYVLPNLTKSENDIQTAYNTSMSLKNSLPSSFSYRSLVSSLVDQIYKIRKEIKDIDKIIETKVERANAIQRKADSRIGSLSSAVSKIGATVGGAVIGAATGGVVGAAVGAATGAAVSTAATKPKNNTGAKQSKSFLSKVGDFFVGAWNGIKNTASKIANGIKSIWQKFTGTIKKIGNKVVDATKKVGKAIFSTGAKVVKGVVSGVKKVGSAIVDGLKWVGSKVVSGVKTAAKWVGDTAKTVTNWVADKFKAVKDWTCKALKDTGAWISKAAKASWAWIKDAASTVWTHMKKIGATIVNLTAALTQGLVKLVESIVDLAFLVNACVNTLNTGLFDILKGIVTGKWDWSATKFLWDKTKSIVAYDCTSKVMDLAYENRLFGLLLCGPSGLFLKEADANAYSWAKRDGLGFKICEGIGYIAGVVVISIFTFGAGGAALGAAAGTTASIGGVTISSTAVALTAAAAGIGKYTQEEWNKNSLSITYGGQEMSLTIDYQKYSEIEKLKDGQSTTITQQFTDENGNPFELKFTITKNGDTYSVTDSNGNAVGFNGVKESSTVGGLGMGVLKGLGDGFKYYTAVSTIGNVQQFTSMAKSIGGGNTLQGFKSMASNFGVKQSLKPLVTNAAKNTFTDVGFYIDSGTHIYTDIETYMKTGEFNILKTGAKIVGAYGINFLGNVAGEYFSKGLNTSLEITKTQQLETPSAKTIEINDGSNPEVIGSQQSTIAEVQISTVAATSGDALGKKYGSYDEILDHYSVQRQKFEMEMTDREKALFNSYCGESWLESGNYKSVNGIGRGNMIDYDNQKITIRGTGGKATTMTFTQFELSYGETVENFVTRQKLASIELNDALSRFRLDEDTILYRGVNYDALQSYGISPGDSAETIFKKLTATGDTYSDAGFMSTAVVPTGITKGKPILLELNCKAGTTGALAESFNPFGENEFLLTAGQSFSIDGVEIRDGQVVVHLTSILK